jgi:hypothetical protein
MRTSIKSAAALGIVALALAFALPVSASAAAKKSLYAISLSATASIDLNSVRPGMDYYGQPPDGCLDNTTTTEHWAVSVQMSAKPARIPLIGVPGDRYFAFHASLGSLNTSVYDEVDGSWTVDPFHYPAPVDPSVCAFTPFRVTAPCVFGSWKDDPVFLDFFGREAVFSIDHDQGVYDQIAQCQTHGNANGSPAPGAAGEGAPFLDRIPTTLRVRVVLSLAKGRRISASGTVTKPEVWFDGKTDGNEKVTYRLAVKRVR